MGGSAERPSSPSKGAAARRGIIRRRYRPGETTSTTALFGTIEGRGFGRSAVGEGGGPKSAVTR